MEAKLQCEKATTATLSGTLTERDAALAKQEAAARSAEAEVKEKEASLSTLQEQANATLARLEKVQGDITGECMRFLLKSILDLLEAYLCFLI
jgi:chromosome segregation ATPase